MFNKNSKFRTYGENDYKGFIMLKNRNTNEVSKHYISSVNKDVLGDVKITVRSSFGDVSIPYKMGSNPKIDIAVKTWVNERYKNNKRVSNDLPESCYSFTNNAPKGSKIENKKDKIIYRYPSGKTFTKHKSLSQIYGKAYDFRSDG